MILLPVKRSVLEVPDGRVVRITTSQGQKMYCCDLEASTPCQVELGIHGTPVILKP